MPTKLANSLRFLFGRSSPGLPLFAAAWAALVLSAAMPPNVRADQPAWEQGRGYRRAKLSLPASGKTGFTLLDPARTGVTFSNSLSDAEAAANQIRLIGSGVAAGDVDGDGLCDLYFCGQQGRNVLYRNLGGMKFQDVTLAAGVACPDQYSTGAAFADLDGDGDLDLIVTSLGHGARTFANDGRGHFTETTAEWGLASKAGSTTLALADVDGDGDLDLYVTNYRSTTIRSTGSVSLLMVNGKREVRPEDRERFELTPEGMLLEHGEVDTLYLNDGKGHFTAAPWTGGTFLDEEGKPLASPPRDWGLSAMFHDLNGDGFPDLYVCNDFWSPDRVWINDGKGHFRALGRLALRSTSTFTMGVDVADVNRDGHYDIFALDMLSRDHARRMTQQSMIGGMVRQAEKPGERQQVERNTLLVNRGDGTFAETAQLSRVAASDWSWCPVFVDVDLDGYEDLLVTNGHGFDMQDMDAEEKAASVTANTPEKRLEVLRMYPRLNLPKAAFRNQGNLAFSDAGKEWGFDSAGVSHGMCLADLDNDGDLDVIVNNLNAPASIYRNDSVAPRVAVRLKGRGANTRGIGAEIKIEPEGAEPKSAIPSQSQEMISGGRYLSCDDALRVFAASPKYAIHVRWSSGRKSRVEGEANSVYEIEEPSATGGAFEPLEPETAAIAPLFRDASDLLRFVHRDEPFDDFARQPLLPRKFSQSGPAVAWFDLDGDGREDLLIGNGRGGDMGIYRFTGQGTFSRLRPPEPFAKSAGDQAGIVGTSRGRGTGALFAAVSNYETGPTNGPSIFWKEIWAGGFDAKPSFPEQPECIGPILLGDVDGDGHLDLFAGGQILPGAYPKPASSRLYKNVDGNYVLDRESSESLAACGLVSGAVFSDLDGDGFPELLLACQWGPIRVYRHQAGRMVEVTSELGLSSHVGWWNGVATGDLDGDGRMDIIASNWGRNTKYESHRTRPLELYYGDLTGAGLTSVIEAYFDPALGRVVPEKRMDQLSRELPWLREKYPTHAAFSSVGVSDFLGDRFPKMARLSANWLETTVFLNRGGRFEAVPLPPEAQFAPVFGVTVADFDGDGAQDIFLAQNFFATDPETSRYDAGRGLLLKGDGRGGFVPMAASESGIAVYGEQRACAAADFDGDGRTDLVVTQNSGPAKLYKNESARPGLRVRLAGPPGNVSGYGASLRLGEAGSKRMGPAVEVQAGGGYWSQDAAIHVLTAPFEADRVSVRWPGGKVSVAPVPSGAKEVSVDITGAVKVLR